MSALLTEAELAERLRVTPEQAAAMRTKFRWEHVRLGRYVVRYSVAQAERIEAAHTVKAERPVALPGQTDLSAKRSA